MATNAQAEKTTGGATSHETGPSTPEIADLTKQLEGSIVLGTPATTSSSTAQDAVGNTNIGNPSTSKPSKQRKDKPAKAAKPKQEPGQCGCNLPALCSPYWYFWLTYKAAEAYPEASRFKCKEVQTNIVCTCCRFWQERGKEGDKRGLERHEGRGLCSVVHPGGSRGRANQLLRRVRCFAHAYTTHIAWPCPSMQLHRCGHNPARGSACLMLPALPTRKQSLPYSSSVNGLAACRLLHPAPRCFSCVGVHSAILRCRDPEDWGPECILSHVCHGGCSEHGAEPCGRLCCRGTALL